MNGPDEQSHSCTEGNKSVTDANENNYKSFSDKRKRYLLVPYLVGLIWILCHPIVSIITGEPKCRGIYTDEHMFDVRTFWSEPYPAITLGRTDEIAQDTSELMCQVIRNPLETDHVQLSLPHSIQCYEYIDISVVKITPFMAPTTPTEAIVLVFPYVASWKQSALHTYLLLMIDRLSFKPWLAKSILIIVPNASNISTGYSVDVFFDLFYGSDTTQTLPFSISSLLVRQLIVIETEFSDENISDRIVILPHGAHGTLPNLDLVSAVKLSLWRAWLRSEPKLQVHPYSVSFWEEQVRRVLPKNRWLRQWVIDLIHMMAFMMASFGRTAPHATALSHGIDSITIRAQINRSNPSEIQIGFVALTLRAVEHLVRGLSNLSERLHHNVNQYILPNGKNFVSFSEYIVPSILVLIPLVVRVFLLLLVDIRMFHFYIIFISLIGAVILSLVFYGLNFEGIVQNAISIPRVRLFFIYITTLVVSRLVMSKTSVGGQKENSIEKKQNVQMVACLLSIYIHVPILLFHVSLGLMPSIFLVPILAFPSHGDSNLLTKVLLLLFLILPWVIGSVCDNLIVLNAIAQMYAAYTPIYFLLGILYLC